MYGLALARQMRQRHVALPLVLFSSLGRREAGDVEGLFNAYLAKPIRQSHLFDTLVGLLAHDAAPKIEAAPGKPQLDPGQAARHPLRILLAEDNVVNQKLALRLLQQMGYRADLASNGIEAERAAQRARRGRRRQVPPSGALAQVQRQHVRCARLRCDGARAGARGRCEGDRQRTSGDRCAHAGIFARGRGVDRAASCVTCEAGRLACWWSTTTRSTDCCLGAAWSCRATASQRPRMAASRSRCFGAMGSTWCCSIWKCPRWTVSRYS